MHSFFPSFSFVKSKRQSFIAGLEQTTSCPLPPAPMANTSFVWGDYDSASIVLSLNVANSEVVHWRKNTFLVSIGNTGQAFVSKLCNLYRAYANGSALEAAALKACTVLNVENVSVSSRNAPIACPLYIAARIRSWAVSQS